MVTITTEEAVDQEVGIFSSDAIDEARALAEEIHRSADILLERFISHLSQLPEHPATTSEDEDLLEENGRGYPLTNDEIGDNNYEEEAIMLKRGFTLPVTAVAWLSSQLDALGKIQKHHNLETLSTEEPTIYDEEDGLESNHCTYDLEPWLETEAAASLRIRLNILRFLLPRAQFIRLTGQSWLPRSSSNDDTSLLYSASSTKQRRKKWWRKIQRQSRPDDEDNDATQTLNERRADEFLRYARRFEYGASKCVNLRRLFPNASVLILECVPPSWIDLKGEECQPIPSSQCPKQSAIQLISVTNAAVYDLKDFLPLSSAPSSVLISSLPSALRSPVSHSLTHLKLENCSLGELTSGFSSSLAQLTRLEYLSLRKNQFRFAKTLLRGLRPLTRLRYLDVSANRLIGCFGPYSNLCLGGQVRTLKLSENLLETCRNSGLEKCYAIRELWLDSNNIQDVVEVSGLARLPDLQYLVLRKNPFSTRAKLSAIQRIKKKPSFFSTTETDNYDSSTQANPLYDRNWKIRLWTWFQHERQAETPLELPLFNKKTKNVGLNHNRYDAPAIGRMTRDEWDRIQEESYLIVTTATTITVDPSLNIQSEHAPVFAAEEGSSRTKKTQSTTKISDLSATSEEKPVLKMTTNSLVRHSPFMSSVRNRRVTKKTKTRRARIHNTNNNSRSHAVTNSNNAIRCYKSNRDRWRQHGKGKKKGSELSTEKNSQMIHKGANIGKVTCQMENKKHISFAADSELKTSNDSKSSLQTRYISSRDERAPMIPSRMKVQHLSFSLQDVLVSLQEEHLKQDRSPDTESETLLDSLNDKGDVNQEDENQKFPLPKELSGKSPVDDDFPNNPFTKDYDAPNNPFLEDDVSQDNVAPNHNVVEFAECNEIGIQKLKKDRIRIGRCNDKEKEPREPEAISAQTKEDHSDTTRLSKGEKEEYVKSNGIQELKTTDETSKTESVISSSRSLTKRSPRRTPQRSLRRPPAIDEDRIFIRPNVASIRLNRMGKYKPFDALSSDWDDVVKKASEGRIPDGLLKSPVDQPPNELATNGDIFPDMVADLISNTVNENSNPEIDRAVDIDSGSRSTSDPALDAAFSSNNRVVSALPKHIWQDDNSVLSSLGGSRDDVFPRANKFQLAEENCAYDGPDSSRGMKVVENLQLYFDSFVFPTSTPDIPTDILEEMLEDQDDWQLITMYYPRIQLWPDDRRFLELELARISSSMHSAEWTTNRERFLRVWEDDIVPCGRSALRRLPPNRRNRLGFHGDNLFANAEVDAYCECRKVLLCLSSKAFYVIPEQDDVTLDHQQQVKKRRFPLPFDRGDRFRDAPWPHAVARHCLSDLEAISIGFEFQRLTLRFRNQALPKSDPFVYVLLTGDKRTSVRILQEIQKLAKDLGDSNALSNLGTSSSAKRKNSSSIDIENDSHIVLDSLHSLIDNTQTIGTILHFQLVQQFWKHGDRGTVRRVCVITDTNILLLDEDYAADGHDLSSVTVKGKHMADARYGLVDYAALSYISQVQAAGNDPKSITIVIQPSTLSRAHRWRLICRDREGAERLVEDARKAIADI